MVPVKRFDDHLDVQVIRRLNSLEPGALLPPRCGHPPRLGRLGDTRGYLTPPVGGAVRRTRVRPWIRAGLRCRGRAPRSDRGTPPGHRMCLSDHRCGNRRAVAAPSFRQHRACDDRPARPTRGCDRTTVSVRAALRGGPPDGGMTNARSCDLRPDLLSQNAVGATWPGQHPLFSALETNICSGYAAITAALRMAEGTLWPTSPGSLAGTA